VREEIINELRNNGSKKSLTLHLQFVIPRDMLYFAFAAGVNDPQTLQFAEYGSRSQKIMDCEGTPSTVYVPTFFITFF